MPYQLTDLKITNVDRVRRGANGMSRIVLFKSADNTDPIGKKEDMPEAFDIDTLGTEARAKVDEIIAERDDALAKAITPEAIADAVEKVLSEMTAESVADRFEGVELVKEAAPSDEDIMKGLPESVVAEIAKGRDASERVAKMEEREAIREQVEFAKSNLAGLTETPADLGVSLHAIHKSLDEEQWQTVTRLLKSAAGQAAEASAVLMAERGATGGVPSDGSVALAERQSEVAKAQNMTVHQALNWIADNEPDMIAKARA
jgi:hypothetical protein